MIRTLLSRPLAHSGSYRACPPHVFRSTMQIRFSSVPSNFKYTKEHEWVRFDGKAATVGLTDHAQTQLGDIVFVDLPKVGSKVAINESIASVESVKAVSEVFAPFSGEIIGVNETLDAEPELVNSDPYEDGYLFRATVDNPEQSESMLTAEEYQKFLEDGEE